MAGLFTPPRVIGIAANQEFEVSAGAIHHWEWTVLANQPVCRLTGHIQVTDGGNRDVRVFVMTRDDFANMVNGHEARVTFQTDQMTAIDLDVVTRTAGPKVLAISNRFSVITDKHVQLTGVQVSCQ